MANGKISVDFLPASANTETIDPKFVPTGQPTPATVQDEGNTLTTRSKLDFQGDGVTVTDDATHGKTIVTIPGGAGVAYTTVADEGTNVTQRRTLNFIGSGVAVTDNAIDGRTEVTITSGATQAYSTIEDEGTPLTQRSNLNFTGTGVSVADTGGKTVVTINTPAAAPAYATVEDEGTPVTQRSNLNFVGGGVTVTDAGGKTVVTIPTQATGSNTGDVTLGAVGSTPNANAASLSGQALTLQPASASFPGVVTTAAQTFTGDKTLQSSDLIITSASSAATKALEFKTSGIVGSGSYASLDPVFIVGDQFEGGIGAPEIQIKFRDAGSGASGLGPAQAERSVAEIEKTGTLAVISDDAIRAHYEAYTHGLQNGHAGSYKPVMRLSSYPYMQFQAGPGASMAVAGDVTRSGSTVTVTFSTAAYEHGFSVGDPLFITGGESGWTFSAGTLTVGAVLAWNSFSYTDVSATATVNVAPMLFTIEPDVTVGRKTAKTVDIQTDAAVNPNNYSARFTPSAVTIPSNVTLTVQGPLNANGGVGTAGQVLTSQGAGSPPQWAAGGGGGSAHTIQDEGSSLTARSILNFVGGAITASDDGVSKTLVTVLPASTSQEGVVTTGAQDFGGRKGFPGTPVNTDGSYTVASIDQLPSFVKNDANARVFYGTRVKPQFNFGASNASTEVTGLEVSSTDTAITGLDYTIANFAQNDGTKFKVKGNGEIQFNGQPGTSGQLLQSNGAAASPTWATSITDTSHGNRGGGALHSNATTSVAGFMSAADKTALDDAANLRKLERFIDAPAEGWATGAYREVTGGAFPSLVVWWESAAKLKKIMQTTYTRNGSQQATTVEHIVYQSDGSTPAKTVTDTVTYSGAYETSRTRAIT